MYVSVFPSVQNAEAGGLLKYRSSRSLRFSTGKKKAIDVGESMKGNYAFEFCLPNPSSKDCGIVFLLVSVILLVVFLFVRVLFVLSFLMFLQFGCGNTSKQWCHDHDLIFLN